MLLVQHRLSAAVCRWVEAVKGWVQLAVPELMLAADIFPTAQAHTAFDDVTHRAAAAVSRLAQAILTAPRSPDKVPLLCTEQAQLVMATIHLAHFR